MNMLEARIRIWQRMAQTARNDVDIGDWIMEEAEEDEATARLLEKASAQVARTIEARVRKMKARAKRV